MPLCPEAMAVGDVSYFEYNGGFLDLEQRDKLRRVIGPINKVSLLSHFFFDILFLFTLLILISSLQNCQISSKY